ncbi:MAG: YigZ family protein, partial [Phototrophicales bacterium]
MGHVTTVEEARAFIQFIRNEMPDASHHVYAFRVGYGNSVIEGMSDDGEPKGTSGPPTLATLRGSDLGDVVLVTTRYFGGTKLGTGGLVRAYTQSAQEALGTLRTEIKTKKKIIGVDVPYHLYEIVKRIIEDTGGSILDETFAGDVTLIAEFVESVLEDFSKQLQEQTSGQITIVPLS